MRDEHPPEGARTAPRAADARRRSAVSSDDLGGDDPRSDEAFLARLGGDLPRLQRIARLLVGDPAVADDLVAEAIARTLPRWRTGDVSDLGPYLRTVLVHLARRRWRVRSLGRDRDHRAAEWTRPARDAAGDVADRDRTLRALAQLPARRRAVVVLRFYDDLTEAQIAEVLGIEVGTVKSQLSRALGQFRVALGALEA